MKKRKIALLCLMPLVLASCGGNSSSEPSSAAPSSSVAPSSSSVAPSSESSSSSKRSDLLRKEVQVTMVSHFGEDFNGANFVDTAIYDDAWFLEKSSQSNPELALMSAMTGGVSYVNKLDEKGQKVKDFFADTGFKDVELNTYYAENITLKDSIGVALAQKNLKDDEGKSYTLLAAFPRNAGYGAEWYGDFNMGATGMHEGFRLGRDEMLRFLKKYIESHNIVGDLKLWCAGYSRGAAVANLLGGYLAEDSSYLGSNVSLSPDNIYVYTIGTPRTTPSGLSKEDVLSVSAARGDGFNDTAGEAYEYKGQGVINLSDNQYKGIHNYVAVGDYITKLPYEAWEFSRYGVSESIEYGSPEMLANLKQYSAEAAESFANGKNYSTPLPTKKFDYLKFATVDDETNKISMDALADTRLSGLLSLGENRAEVINNGYASLLGAVAAVYGLDDKDFLDKATADIGSLIKTVVLNVFSYIAKRENKETPQAGIAEAIMDLVELLRGKKIEDRAAYSDQDFLADLLDVLFNEYKENTTRADVIANLLPAPFNNLFLDLLKYNKEKGYTPKTAEGLLELLVNFIYDKKDDLLVGSLITLGAALIPSDYVTMLGFLTGKSYNIDDYGGDQAAMAKAAVLDLIEGCVKGTFNSQGEPVFTAQQMRGVILTAIPAFLLTGAPVIGDLLTNGSYTDQGIVNKDPHPLSELVADILNLLIPKPEEGERPSLDEAADSALVDLLEKCKGGKSDEFIKMLQDEPAKVRELAVTLILAPKEQFDIEAEINNAITFVEAVKFLLPAHYHEMYLAHLKTLLPK